MEISKSHLFVSSCILVSLCSHVWAADLVLGDHIKTPPACQISSRFNFVPIREGRYIWFNSVFSLPGFHSRITEPLTFVFTDVTITVKVNSTPYMITAPNASITFDPSVRTATTTFTAGTPGQWTTTLPASAIYGTNFLDGVAVQVPAGGLPGDIGPVTWQGTFTGGGVGLTVQWEWAAAVYSKFSTNYNALGVKVAGDDRHHDADDEGTPENFRFFLVPGPTGFGGHNYTWFYSESYKRSEDHNSELQSPRIISYYVI
jgi:hypothetical protein